MTSSQDDVVESLVREVRDHLLSNMMAKMAHQSYRRAIANTKDCEVCHTQCEMTRLRRERAQGRDIYGRGHHSGSSHGTNGYIGGTSSPSTTLGILVNCPNCQRDVGSSRFAQHLEKCLNIGGRARRTAGAPLSSQSLLKANSSNGSSHTFSDNEDDRRAKRTMLKHRKNDDLHKQAILGSQDDSSSRERGSGSGAMQRAASLG